MGEFLLGGQVQSSWGLLVAPRLLRSCIECDEHVRQPQNDHRAASLGRKSTGVLADRPVDRVSNPGDIQPADFKEPVLQDQYGLVDPPGIQEQEPRQDYVAGENRKYGDMFFGN